MSLFGGASEEMGEMASTGRNIVPTADLRNSCDPAGVARSEAQRELQMEDSGVLLCRPCVAAASIFWRRDRMPSFFIRL